MHLGPEEAAREVNCRRVAREAVALDDAARGRKQECERAVCRRARENVGRVEDEHARRRAVGQAYVVDADTVVRDAAQTREAREQLRVDAHVAVHEQRRNVLGRECGAGSAGEVERRAEAHVGARRGVAAEGLEQRGRDGRVEGVV